MLKQWWNPQPLREGEGAGGGGATPPAGGATPPAGGATPPTSFTLTADELKTNGLDKFIAADGKILLGDLAGRVTKASQFETEAEARAKALPGSSDKYEVAPSKEFKLPENFKFELDPDFSKAVQAWAHKHGMTQSAVHELVELYTSDRIADANADTEYFTAEKGKLGVNATARIDAVNNFLKGNLSVDQFKSIGSVTQSAAAVEAIEKLISMAKGAVVPPNNQNGGKGAVDMSGLDVNTTSPLNLLKAANAAIMRN